MHAAHSHTHTHTHTCAYCTLTHTQTHTHSRARGTLIHTHTHTHVCVYSTHTHICTQCMCTHTHARSALTHALHLYSVFLISFNAFSLRMLRTLSFLQRCFSEHGLCIKFIYVIVSGLSCCVCSVGWVRVWRWRHGGDLQPCAQDGQHHAGRHHVQPVQHQQVLRHPHRHVPQRQNHRSLRPGRCVVVIGHVSGLSLRIVWKVFWV